MSMDIERLLENIQKPARYIGGEWNSVKKDFDSARVKVALCFPDAYEIGMSHLGLKILYHLLNEAKGVVCERVFMPWFDMQERLRKESALLFSLESKRPLSDFDIIGFSLEHELNYTNVLAMLSLSNIPLRSAERGAEYPLVIAGGICCVNPEPMADFFDAFFIGEAEEGILEIIEKITNYKLQINPKSQIPNSKTQILKELSKIEGVYVPSFYDVKYNDDGAIKSFTPKDASVPAVIKKRIVKDFENAYYPIKQIVPFIQIVHDRISLEVMRGCPNKCKFCQATAVYFPVRLRSADKILELAEKTYQATGHDEISLVSLSTGDHPQILEIVRGLTDRFISRRVSISLPSLRAEDMLRSLPELISSIKKTGFTFAPEAGSQRLRDSLNKRLDITKLYDCAAQAAKNGWRRVKLYFMIGLPGETEEDLSQIKELVKNIPAQKTVSVSYFVPKPHTDFETESMVDMESLKQKQEFLCRALKVKGVDLKWHDINMSFLEAVLSRGDRRASAVILRAYELGARFDSWKEGFNSQIWQKAFESSGIDPGFYLYRKKGQDEVMPWKHIQVLI
ncbi:MAG: B12-binding domain-containing radical SAM protein [Candidatus Omnitrophica bacterium CG12_big_fil_rev_8_21_14_0_65_43_15]|uniref:B12-binding domain-containing radical SAM protein n=1 Tax=Candidatus Taenaricola geysiri TaxID=1974752 RepID=A0A2J0LG07_9BACT|nr:MAG: B12-binding domain-containing radical SAM protein [Candidatus Omnitrophica bacterium CG12_big_fil_rev_8_21_14_0_65_43_15]